MLLSLNHRPERWRLVVANPSDRITFPGKFVPIRTDREVGEAGG